MTSSTIIPECGNRNLKRASFQVVASMFWFESGDNLYKNQFKCKVAEGRVWCKALPFARTVLAKRVYTA